MRLPPCLNMLCQKGMCIVSYRASISPQWNRQVTHGKQGKRQSLARRTTRNDRLSLDRSSIPLRKGRRPAIAGQRGFLNKFLVINIVRDSPKKATIIRIKEE